MSGKALKDLLVMCRNDLTARSRLLLPPNSDVRTIFLRCIVDQLLHLISSNTVTSYVCNVNLFIALRFSHQNANYIITYSWCRSKVPCTNESIFTVWQTLAELEHSTVKLASGLSNRRLLHKCLPDITRGTSRLGTDFIETV